MSSRLSDPLRTAVNSFPELNAPEAMALTSPAPARANSLMTVGMMASSAIGGSARRASTAPPAAPDESFGQSALLHPASAAAEK
jgi:hypothetical protein